MTYYAVTNDPNELMHFGIKGMKWGVTRTPEQLGHHKSPKPSKPRSPAYQKASAKLGRMMRHGIAKAQAKWEDYNSPYSKAERAYKRNEKAFQKHLQLAREGRLKYKGISDEEVGRITDRLALERSSRLLSGSEKQSFGRRLRERVGEGVIEGAGRGVSSYVADRISTRGRAKAEIKAERIKNRAELTPAGLLNKGVRAVNNLVDDLPKNAKAKRDARNEAEENYVSMVNENRDLDYDSVFGAGSHQQLRLHNYSIDNKHIKSLSTAELNARTNAIKNAKELYNKGSVRRQLTQPQPGNAPSGSPIVPSGSHLPPAPPNLPPVPPAPSNLPPAHSNTSTYLNAAHNVRSLHNVRRAGINNLASATNAFLDEKYAEGERLAERTRQLAAADAVRQKRERNAAEVRKHQGLDFYGVRRTEREEREARDQRVLDTARLYREDRQNNTGLSSWGRDMPEPSVKKREQSWRVTRTQARKWNLR